MHILGATIFAWLEICQQLSAQINSPCRTLLIWKARQEDWEAKKQPEKRPKQFIFRKNEKKSNGKFDSDSGGDSDCDSNGKKRKAKKCQGKYKKLAWWKRLLLPKDCLNLGFCVPHLVFCLTAFCSPVFLIYGTIGNFFADCKYLSLRRTSALKFAWYGHDHFGVHKLFQSCKIKHLFSRPPVIV